MTRKREGRHPIRPCENNNTHHRAVMWNTLYLGIQLPHSLKKLDQDSQDMLQLSLMTSEEMNDSPDPPPTPLPVHADSTSRAMMPTVSTSTTEPWMSK